MFKNLFGWVKSWWENKKPEIVEFIVGKLNETKPEAKSFIQAKRKEIIDLLTKNSDDKAVDLLYSEIEKIVRRQM